MQFYWKTIKYISYRHLRPLCQNPLLLSKTFLLIFLKHIKEHFLKLSYSYLTPNFSKETKSNYTIINFSNFLFYKFHFNRRSIFFCYYANKNYFCTILFFYLILFFHIDFFIFLFFIWQNFLFSLYFSLIFYYLILI